MRGRKLASGLILSGVTALGITPAAAYSNGAQRSETAPGQERAIANCEDVVLAQEENEVWPGGGPKTEAGVPGPTNCDHWYQDDLDLIGNWS